MNNVYPQISLVYSETSEKYYDTFEKPKTLKEVTKKTIWQAKCMISLET